MESGHLDSTAGTDPLSKPDPEDPESEKPSSSKENEDNGSFDCNICLEMAKEAVISMCGHLFCWPCLLQWLETRPNRQLCPVCKSGISKEQVIPLYGRNGDKTDPRKKIPPRPRGQRTEAPQGFPGFQWGGDGGAGGGVQFSLGIGVFPFSVMYSFFNNAAWDRRPEPPAQGSRQHQEEHFLNNVFTYIGVFFILWLLLV